MCYDCIIIGAGAAGLFCGAGFPKRVNGLILEKTGRIGTKLLMSGNGQCNITHGGSIKDFIHCYGESGKKIRSCLYQYHNHHLRLFLHENGIDTFEREDGKIFPQSLDSKDIQTMLIRRAKRQGFSIETNSEVISLGKSGNFWRVATPDREFTSKTVVIAAGGSSYPATGSDGSMLHMLQKQLDIPVVTPKPALSPIKVENYPFTDMAGIGFPHGKVSILHSEKTAASNVGGLLLTHRDFSGPAIMNISKYGKTGDHLKLNYIYPETFEQAFAKLKTAMSEGKESPSNLISHVFQLPKRFCRLLVTRYGSSPKTLARALTEETFTITSCGSFRQATVTAGGIDLSAVDLKTMEIKKYPNLFAIGEILDVDGITGGYNLQFAYASACAALNEIIRRQTADNHIF